MLEEALFQPHFTVLIDKDDRQIRSCLIFLEVFGIKPVLGNLGEL